MNHEHRKQLTTLSRLRGLSVTCECFPKVAHNVVGISGKYHFSNETKLCLYVVTLWMIIINITKMVVNKRSFGPSVKLNIKYIKNLKITIFSQQTLLVWLSAILTWKILSMHPNCLTLCILMDSALCCCSLKRIKLAKNLIISQKVDKNIC